MATKRDTTRTEVRDDIERVRTLVAAEDSDAARELSEETAEKIKTLPVKERADWDKQLEDAGTPKKVYEGMTLPANVETQDWRDAVPDELMTSTSTAMRDGINSLMSASEYAMEMADRMLKVRLHITNKAGVPDFKVRAQQTRDAASEIYARAGEGLERDYEGTEALKKLMRAVQWRMKDAVVTYVKGLDDDDAEYRKHFPMVAEAHPDLSPSEAVYAYYESIGQALPRKGNKEIDQEKYQARLERGSDGEDDVPADEVDPDTKVRTVLGALRKEVKSISAQDVEHASADVKREAVEAISEISQQIKIIGAAAL